MKDNDGTVYLACLGAVLVVPITLVISYGLGGWVLSVLWGWFIVPLFDVSQITVLQAIGLTVVAGMFATRKADTKAEENPGKAILTSVLWPVAYPLAALLVGWLVHLMM